MARKAKPNPWKSLTPLYDKPALRNPTSQAYSTPRTGARDGGPTVTDSQARDKGIYGPKQPKQKVKPVAVPQYRRVRKYKV